MKKRPPLVSDLLGAINRIAPANLAESWDNVGLQLGDPAAKVERVLVALEISDAVLKEARELRANCIITHHPLIFSPLKMIVPTTPVGRFVTELIRSGIALIAAHTNLDSVPHGTNGVLASALQLEGLKPLFPNTVSGNDQVKYAVFVPVDHVAVVIEAIHQSGAGVIGDYTHCTFSSPGTGTYKPQTGANPFAGKIGELEHAENEVRLETVCPRKNLQKLILAVNEVHPYEEVAFDVYPLIDVQEPEMGLGLVGKLKEKTSLADLAEQCRTAFSVEHLGLVGEPTMKVQRIAICSGAGGEVVRRWRPGMADVLLTGEMTHHQAAELRDRGAAAILLGHFASEVIVAPRVAELLTKELAGFAVEIHVAKGEKDPITVL